MMTITLPEKEPQIKTLTNEGFGDVGSEVEPEPTPHHDSIVIRIGLEGICSVQILADRSDEEEQLRERLTAARPALEWMHRTIQALNAEAVGVGG